MRITLYDEDNKSIEEIERFVRYIMDNGGCIDVRTMSDRTFTHLFPLVRQISPKGDSYIFWRAYHLGIPDALSVYDELSPGLMGKKTTSHIYMNGDISFVMKVFAKERVHPKHLTDFDDISELTAERCEFILDLLEIQVTLDDFLFAIRSNNIQVLQVLVNRGYTFIRDTPIIARAPIINTDVLRFLLNNGADPNAKYNGFQPLSLKSYLQNLDNLRLLLEYGADPNVKNKDGYYPLTLSVPQTSPDIASLLLEFGADPSLPNDNGKSSLYYALFSRSNAREVFHYRKMIDFEGTPAVFHYHSSRATLERLTPEGYFCEEVIYRFGTFGSIQWKLPESEGFNSVEF